MKSEYLFRGKVKGSETGCKELDWAVGNLVVEQSTDRHYIADLSHFDDVTKLHEVMIEVEPETVSRCVGICDKNSERMWENDVVLVRGDEEPALIEWNEDDAEWCMTQSGSVMYDFENCWACDLEVIGNRFDNPELLGGL